MLRLGAVLMVLCSALMHFVPAAAAESFYDNRQVTIVVGYGPGGAYDLYARMLARHMGKYISGKPNFTVQNMPGAGSLRAANYLYSSAPADGATFGIFARNMPLLSILGVNPAVKFDAHKFTWIGSASNYQEDAYLFFVRPDVPIRSVADLQRRDTPALPVGGTAQGASGNDVPILLRDVLGLNMRLVPGYPDAGALYLAMERGEIDGRATDMSGVMSGRPQWLDPQNGMRVVLQFGRATRHPNFPDVPTARELAPDAAARAIIEAAEMPYLMSRPFAAPPRVPSDRAAILRTAFLSALSDTALQAEAEKMGLGLTPVSGENISELLDSMLQIPQQARDYLRVLMKESQ